MSLAWICMLCGCQLPPVLPAYASTFLISLRHPLCCCDCKWVKYSIRNGTLKYSITTNRSSLTWSPCCPCLRVLLCYVCHGTWTNLSDVRHNSLISVCVCMCIPLSLLYNGLVKIFTRQWIHTTARESLDTSFSARFLPYQTIGDLFFPELLVNLFAFSFSSRRLLRHY
jgi:hypothetical protein